MLDVAKIKSDFPILSKKIHGKPLVYLDNAATSHKPKQVIDAMSNYYLHHNANVHRGVHQLSEESTDLWEKSRQTIADFLGAMMDELIVVRNTTEAINGIAYGWADHHLSPEHTILLTDMEHHSNLVTWQEVAKRTGSNLKFIQVDDEGRLDLDDLRHHLRENNVKLLAFTHVSNTLGTLNPLEKIVEIVRKSSPDTRILVDGAQSAPHLKISFDKLNVDFFVLSGHKMLAPMGVGGLIVRKSLLASGEMQPWLFGGGMIDSVTLDQTKFHPDLSEKFVAGTPDVASAVGLAAACEYLSQIGLDKVETHDRELVEYALKKLAKNNKVKFIGPTIVGQGQLDRIGSVAFIYQGVHAHDIAQILDSEGVAVRSGHHCTMPLHLKFAWQASVRASFQVYNTTEDIDALCEALEKVEKVFG